MYRASYLFQLLLRRTRVLLNAAGSFTYCFLQQFYNAIFNMKYVHSSLRCKRYDTPLPGTGKQNLIR
ncbi:hypothetical protein BH11BAC6_BH11BAC6_14980 [soil metagenome]